MFLKIICYLILKSRYVSEKSIGYLIFNLRYVSEKSIGYFTIPKFIRMLLRTL